MKSILIIVLLSSYFVCVGQTSSLAFGTKEGRRCTGSMYCTACKNCTGCKHCAKNGGSCGVCGPKSKRNYSSKRSSNSYNDSSPTNFSINYKEGDLLMVTSNTLNLREGPGTNYKVLERLSKSDKVKLLKVVNSWLMMQVVKTGTIGYLYTKYTLKL